MKNKIELSSENWLLVVAALEVVKPYLQGDMKNKISEITHDIKQKTFEFKLNQDEV